MYSSYFRFNDGERGYGINWDSVKIGFNFDAKDFLKTQISNCDWPR
jgi:hypothetical protein